MDVGASCGSSPSTDVGNVNTQQQQQRTFLRERFLRLLTSIRDKPISLLLHNQKTVTAQFGASDVDVLHFQVNQLETPLGKHSAALLRTGDIITMTVDLGTTQASSS